MKSCPVRAGHPFAGFVFFWVDVVFVVVVPTLAAMDFAGLRLSSREEFDTIESESDDDGDGGGGARQARVRQNESDDAIFSRYTRASDWR